MHADWHKIHHLRCILDEIFGSDRFLNEIIWGYGAGGKNPSKFFPRKHDTILWYAKSTNHFFTKDLFQKILRVPYDDSIPETHYKNRDEQGRRFRVQTVNGRDYVTYADDGKLVTDVWVDIGAQNAGPPISPEYTGFPTQKPEMLLERIVCAASDAGSLVFDCFMGSGPLPPSLKKLAAASSAQTSTSARSRRPPSG